jgi:NADP-dependent 3-hydroxy acid dehydrogenase YdfG
LLQFLEEVHMSPAQVQTQAVQPKNLFGKIAVVAGGSWGIGAAIASRLATEVSSTR